MKIHYNITQMSKALYYHGNTAAYLYDKHAKELSNLYNPVTYKYNDNYGHETMIFNKNIEKFYKLVRYLPFEKNKSFSACIMINIVNCYTTTDFNIIINEYETFEKFNNEINKLLLWVNYLLEHNNKMINLTNCKLLYKSIKNLNIFRNYIKIKF
jgi:hypothetical protein